MEEEKEKEKEKAIVRSAPDGSDNDNVGWDDDEHL